MTVDATYSARAADPDRATAARGFAGEAAARPPVRRLRRLRVLTWHVHGNYLYYLSQAPHDFHLLTLPGHPPGHAGRGGLLPWGDNVHEAPADALDAQEFDCVLYQHIRHWQDDRHSRLSQRHRALPAVFLEHDPPLGHPTDTLHPAAKEGVPMVHVTPYNALMWDNGDAPVTVIEHGVVLPPAVRYSGELEAGVVVVNNLKRRGRRLGIDVFEQARRKVPLTLAGMDSEALGGIGEVPNPALPGFMARHRFFFNPIRYTSLGLAVVEAMTLGLPVVGLATTEMVSVVRNGVNGFVDTRPERLFEVMKVLLEDPALAARWGEAARKTALERFSIQRFASEWDQLLRRVADHAF